MISAPFDAEIGAENAVFVFSKVICENSTTSAEIIISIKKTVFIILINKIKTGISMKYQEIKIVERSNRHESAGNEILAKYGRLPRSMNMYYATYTVINKVGINPRSGYNTPIGIYSYPLKYVVSKIENYGSATAVDYMGDASYINIFKPKQVNKGWDIASYSKSDFDSDYQKLFNYFVVQKNMCSASEFYGIVQDAINNAARNSPSGRMWNFTRILAMKVADGYFNTNESVESLIDSEIITEWQDKRQAKRSSVVWNGILRNILKYDYVVDSTGEGVIHPAEPTQAVFLSTQTLEVVDTIRNKESGLSHKIKQIEKIGLDDNKQRATARQNYEFEKLIAQNLNHVANLDNLKNEFYRVSSPKLQRSLIQKNPINIMYFLDFDPLVQNYAKSQTIRLIKGISRDRKSETAESIFGLISSQSESQVFFDTLGINEDWPEFESAVEKYIEEQGSSYNNVAVLAFNYAILIKNEPWKELEPYIKSRESVWRVYSKKFNLTDNVFFPGNLVMINKPKQQEPGKVVDIKQDDGENTQYVVATLDGGFKLKVLSDNLKLITDDDKKKLQQELPYEIGNDVIITSDDILGHSGKPVKGWIDYIEYPYVWVKLHGVGSYFNHHKVSVYDVKLDNSFIDSLKFKVGDPANVNNPKASGKNWTIDKIDNDGVTLKNNTSGQLVKKSYEMFYKANPKLEPDDPVTGDDDIDNLIDIDFEPIEEPADYHKKSNDNIKGFKVGDQVEVISGTYKGISGKIIELVSDLNAVKMTNTNTLIHVDMLSKDTEQKLKSYNQQAVKAAIADAKQKGYITYNTMHGLFPLETDPEQIEDFIDLMSELGINVVESD